MKYNSIGEQLIAKAQELDPSYKPDKFNDMSEALDVILNNSSRGYKIKKLTITENGLYDNEFEAYKPVVVEVPQISKNGTLLKTLLDATKSTYYLFREYKGTSVDDLISYIDTSNVTYMYAMFSGCNKLTTIPILDTSNVENMVSMFEGCTNLTSVPALDVSKCINFGSVFRSCSKLTSIGMYGFRYDISISDTALEHDAIVALLNQAGTANNKYAQQRITIGSAKLALLSDEEKAIATNKGWTLA